MSMTVQGKGNAAKNGGINGDLYVVFEEEPDPVLTREDNNLVYKLNISVPDAILGTTAEIPTISGKVKFKIEPGTQPGSILRLKGKGLPTYGEYGKGDLLVLVNVWIPNSKNLSRSDIKIIEDMQKSEGFGAKQADSTSKSSSIFDRLFGKD